MDVVTGFKEEDLKGFEVEYRGGYILRRPLGEIEKVFLKNEWQFLNKLKDTVYVPIPISFVDNEMVTVYAGESERVTNPVKFINECAQFIQILNKRGIRHGDLTAKNIIVVDNVPVVIDWKQSKFADDPTPDKRPEGDAYHLLLAIVELINQ